MLGLVILAVVSSLVQAGTVNFGEVSMIIVEAVLFLGGSIVIGRAMAPYLLRWVTTRQQPPACFFH